MFRRIIIFIVLLVHINGSMLLPQVAEHDIYTSSGQEKDDINSVIEYIDEVIMGHQPPSPADEDNDQGQYFHLVKMVDYYYEIDFSLIRHKPPVHFKTNKYSLFREGKISFITLEIPAPPPKA